MFSSTVLQNIYSLATRNSSSASAWSASCIYQSCLLWIRPFTCTMISTQIISMFSIGIFNIPWRCCEKNLVKWITDEDLQALNWYIAIDLKNLLLCIRNICSTMTQPPRMPRLVWCWFPHFQSFSDPNDCDNWYSKWDTLWRSTINVGWYHIDTVVVPGSI